MGRAVERVAAQLRRSRRVLFITGAGLSADSGMPTYRGVGGIYDRGLTEEGIPIEEAVSGPMMARRPEVCWKYIHEIARVSRGAGPNRGHEVIALLERHLGEVWVLTQNVDGLHRRAGSTRIIDIHGDVSQLLCTVCSWRRSVTDYGELAPLPRCPDCDAVVRPDVVLFGEMLPVGKLALLRRELARGFDAVFSVGTSSLFPYIAEPVVAASRAGIFTVEVNPETTVVSPFVEVALRTGAARALDAVMQRFLA
ncbi:MAG: NAD-dependent protein deacylase [Deltaproteobacteria bacterium]|nr:NAD-dependent protein deacylase [Deltaproteobacteria bacterium]